MTQCCVCNERPLKIGNLCEECSEALANPHKVVPEQLLSNNAPGATHAVIDRWGRAHRLADSVTFGRKPSGAGSIAILDGSVSREHARLDKTDEGWTATDLKSSNGTFVADSRVVQPAKIAPGNTLFIAGVGFYFVEAGGRLLDVEADDTAGVTLRPGDSVPAMPGSKDVDDSTFPGLPEIEMTFTEPTGGGGGFVETLGKRLQLTTTQFEFVSLLARRMLGEPEQPELVRGFVRSSELIGALSWDTPHPADNHVKQLVRRVRRALVRAEIGNLVESRHRFGYRMRVIPKLTPKSLFYDETPK